MTGLDELLTDCDVHGIQLLPADDGGLTVDAPQDALTPGLLDRLKNHKGELLAILWPAPDTAPPVKTSDALTNLVCRCGSTTWRDVPIHGGQSTRRDCDQCGRFIDFLRWYGNDRTKSPHTFGRKEMTKYRDACNKRW